MVTVAMDDIDRISNLPDEVLYHILSFLPTENVVATSILSTRWKPLWLLVPALDFDEGRFLLPNGDRSRPFFIHFVYATILARGFHQPIKTFHFKSMFLIPDLKIWLKAAMQREVESIDIELTVQHWIPHIFSCRSLNIFTCKTLVVLKLDWISFNHFSSVHLPSLKTLHLMWVGFSKFQHFMELLYGCPILENLKVKYISFDPSSFEDKFTTLPKLIWACAASYRLHYHPIPMKAFCNVEYLQLERFRGVTVNGLVFPNLIHMKLIMELKAKWNSVPDLLNHCPQLQTLVIENLFCADKVWPDSLHVPECFSSQLRKCFLIHFAGLECEMRFAKYVMQNSTSLRTMTICCFPDLDPQEKLEMIAELASCPRSSETCELLFK